VLGSPVDTLEVTVRLTGGTVSSLPLFARSTDGEVTAKVFGVKGLSPLQWQEQLRKLAQPGGRIEISQLTFVQSDVSGRGSGTLFIKPDGRLDGEVKLTLAGFKHFIQRLNINPAVFMLLVQGKSSTTQTTAVFAVPQQNTAPAKSESRVDPMVDLSRLGEPMQLDGRPATLVGLRFIDSAIFLGPIPVGQIPPLF
jgi:hypothetical protein